MDYSYKNCESAKWILPLCNVSFKIINDLNFIFLVLDILLHLIFITSYLYSLGLVKILIQ